MDAKGIGPEWDEDSETKKSQWGYRDKIEAIRKQMQEKMPPRGGGQLIPEEEDE